MQCSQPVRSAGHIVRYFTITKRLLACSRHWSRAFAHENTVNGNDALMTQINIFLRLSRCDFPRNFAEKKRVTMLFKKKNRLKTKKKQNKTKNQNEDNFSIAWINFVQRRANLWPIRVHTTKILVAFVADAFFGLRLTTRETKAEKDIFSCKLISWVSSTKI